MAVSMENVKHRTKDLSTIQILDEMYSKICRQTTALPMLLNVEDKNSPNSMSKWNVYIYIHVYI